MIRDLSILQLTPLSDILRMGSVYLRHLGEIQLIYPLYQRSYNREIHYTFNKLKVNFELFTIKITGAKK